MATILPILQPNYIVNVQSYNPIDTGVLMGVDVTITDLLATQISVIETTRGLQGYTGRAGSGFRFLRDINNNANYIEASGSSDTLYLNTSGTATLSFNNNTKTLTIGSQPFDTGLNTFPISIGGTNNNNFDVNYLLFFDGNKITSSTINESTLSSFMSSTINLTVGDGNGTAITYNINDDLNIVGSTGIKVSYNDITNTVSISSSGQQGIPPLVASLIFG